MPAFATYRAQHPIIFVFAAQEASGKSVKVPSSGSVTKVYGPEQLGTHVARACSLTEITKVLVRGKDI